MTVLDKLQSRHFLQA